MDQQNLLDLDSDVDINAQRLNNTLPAERDKHNSAQSVCSQDSESSSNDFVKVDEQDLNQLMTTNYSNLMDEKDLYVPEGAGNAEQHPQSRPKDTDLDEFDPLASYPHHELSTVAEKEPIELEFEEGQVASKPKDGDGDKKNEEDLKPKEPETPVDKADEEVIERRHHIPLTTEDDPINVNEIHVEPQRDYNEIAENIRDAVRETHDKVDDILGRFEAAAIRHPPPQEEQYSPSGDSGRDTIAELNNLNDTNLPASESVSSGMRDLSPELTTFERDGPLTIPSPQQRSFVPSVDEFDDYPYQPPRPPTPPKDLNESGEDNPKELDLGPPPPSHHLGHRGFHSILKHHDDAKAWIDFQSIPSPVQETLLWRNPKNSAIALALALLGLILVAKFTFISLLAWGSLIILGATLGFRVFKVVESQVKKTDGSNPFKPYLEPSLEVPQEKVHAQADVLVHHGQALIGQLRRLFLVECVFDSVKFAVLLWTLTYIGAWFSGITLITLFVLGLFSIPKIYEVYKEPIDEYIGLARQNVEKVNQIVQEKLPFLKHVEKVEKKE